MTTDLTRYFLSRDGKTQIAATMTDALHRQIWSRMTYSNRPFANVEIVETDDAWEWISAQMQARVDAANAANPFKRGAA